MNNDIIQLKYLNFYLFILDFIYTRIYNYTWAFSKIIFLYLRLVVWTNKNIIFNFPSTSVYSWAHDLTIYKTKDVQKYKSRHLRRHLSNSNIISTLLSCYIFQLGLPVT